MINWAHLKWKLTAYFWWSITNPRKAWKLHTALHRFKKQHGYK